jgi:organic radical activating enzyme
MQTLVFLTNFCPNQCPYCLCASGPENSNFLDKDFLLENINNKDDTYIHLCGGEPIAHPNCFEIISEILYVKNCSILLYTSIPAASIIRLYDFLDTYSGDKRFGIRISVSNYLSEIDSKHNERVADLCQRLKNSKIPYAVSCVDNEYKKLPKWINTFKTPICNSGREFLQDSMSHEGPKMKVIHSNGEIDFDYLCAAHYKEVLTAPTCIKS